MTSLLIFDVDGSLTNGDIVYHSDQTQSKAFNIKDGLAIATWNKVEGKKSAFITGKKSKMVEDRANELGVSYIYQSISNKKEILDEIIKKENISYEDVAILGDDLNDYSMLDTDCFTFCPKDASFYIKDIVDVVLKSKGGKGAGREMIEYLLKRDPYALKNYLAFYIQKEYES